MNLLTNIIIADQLISTVSSLGVIDNGLGNHVYGAEETIVDYAVLVADKKASLPTQVQGSKQYYMTQGKIDLRNESGRPMKVKVVGEVSEK